MMIVRESQHWGCSSDPSAIAASKVAAANAFRRLENLRQARGLLQGQGAQGSILWLSRDDVGGGWPDARDAENAHARDGPFDERSSPSARAAAWRRGASFPEDESGVGGKAKRGKAHALSVSPSPMKKRSKKQSPSIAATRKPPLDKTFKEVAQQIAAANRGRALSVADVVDACPCLLPEKQAVVVMSVMLAEGLADPDGEGRKAVVVR